MQGISRSLASQGWLRVLLWLGLLLVPLGVQAADGYVNGYVNLRAGPNIRYPLLVTLQPGTPIAVYGCTTGWSWCDVRSGDMRGWISAQFVSYPYDNRRVIIANYGERIGIPIVSFVLGTYWDEHYRNRSWYAQRVQWERPDYRPAPPPPRRGPWHTAQPSRWQHGHGRGPEQHPPGPARVIYGTEHGRPPAGPPGREHGHGHGDGHGSGGQRGG